jgi:hypothetical protein
METLGQVLSATATFTLLMGSGAGLAATHMPEVRTHTFGRLFEWMWRAGALFGVAALLLSALSRSLIPRTDPSSSGWPLLASVGNRAVAVALLAALLSAGTHWRNLFRPGQPPTGWVGLVLIAVAAGISVISWPLEEPSAPILVACTLLAAGLALWAAGEAFNNRTEDLEGNRLAAGLASAGLAGVILVVGAVNWRIWGTPAGVAADAIGGSPQGAFLGLLAVWMISVADLALIRRAKRFVCVLGMLAAALLCGIALSVQWAIPFS